MLPNTLAPGSHLPTRVKQELDFTTNIARGARGMRAKRVQEWLCLHGFALDIDSKFGGATEKRVRDFQTANGLPASGIVDAATHAKLVDPLVQALKPMPAAGRGLSALTHAYASQHIAQHPKESGGDRLHLFRLGTGSEDARHQLAYSAIEQLRRLGG